MTKFLKRDVKAAYKATLARLETLRAEYKGDETPERILLKAEKVLDATTPIEASEAGEKAYQSLFVHLLAEWARGRIEGKDTPIAIETRARQADNLARMLEDKGLDAQAATQRKRAEDIRARLTPSTDSDTVEVVKKTRKKRVPRGKVDS
jgi:hypothetical protein